MTLRPFTGIFIAIFFACPLASAQNMLTNGNFNTDVSGWSDRSYITLLWSADDVNASPSSGSAEVINAHPNAAVGAGISQCSTFPVTPGEAYLFRGDVLIPSGQTISGSATIGTYWTDGPDCTGVRVGIQPRSGTSTTGAWVHLESGWEIADVDAVSVVFLAFSTKADAGGTLVAKFDELYLVPEVVLTDGFESGNTNAWDVTVP